AAYAAFMASFGLWNSVVGRTSLRANLGAVSGAIAVAFGHWLIWMCCGTCALVLGEPPWKSDVFEWVLYFQTFGLTPPATLGLLAFHGWEFHAGGGHLGPGGAMSGMLVCALLGVLVYGFAASVLWLETSRRFRVMSGRVDRLPPEPPAAAKRQAMGQ